jgi:hypothetical protein
MLGIHDDRVIDAACNRVRHLLFERPFPLRRFRCAQDICQGHAVSLRWFVQATEIPRMLRHIHVAGKARESLRQRLALLLVRAGGNLSVWHIEQTGELERGRSREDGRECLLTFNRLRR